VLLVVDSLSTIKKDAMAAFQSRPSKITLTLSLISLKLGVLATTFH
jgi:hypothetical protein